MPSGVGSSNGETPYPSGHPRDDRVAESGRANRHGARVAVKLGLLAREFREAVLAIAQAYGATREDLIAVASDLPSDDALVRRGRPRIDDRDLLAKAERLIRDGAAANDWQAAVAAAQQRPGQSLTATARRIHRALLDPAKYYAQFLKRQRLPLIVATGPYGRARHALAKILKKSPN
jgi:hypothetical protein